MAVTFTEYVICKLIIKQVHSSPGIHGRFVGSLELLQSGTLLQQKLCGLLDLLLFLTFSLTGAGDLTQATEAVGEVGSC